MRNRNHRDDASQRRALYADPTWTWRLWGLPNAQLDFVATLAALALLVWSRFALLPSGPWERDETVFSRGLLKFDLPSAFPHPPGFPLWMALGWLLRPFVPEPLRGFQLLSATASCLTLFPLAALGRRVAPASVAAMGALALLFSPAVWLRAGRGFTSTAATFFALWAAALAFDGTEGKRATVFTLLATTAFLIRPVLLPPLAALWLAGAMQVRPRRRLLPGMAWAGVAVILALLGLVLAQGSWSAFVSAFVTHARTHARNLVEHNPGGVLDLGMVKGIGGPAFALGLAVVAAAGVAVWWRRASVKIAIAWTTVLCLLAFQLVWLQNRCYTRYAVPLHLALAPLAVAAIGLAPPALGAGALGAIGIVWAARSHPLLVEQHTHRLPGWEAAQTAVARARKEALDIVVEPGLYPFLSYLDELDRRQGRESKFDWYLAPASPDAKDLPTRPYLLLTEYPFHYFPALAGTSESFGGVSVALVPFTQGRFLKALVATDVVLPVRGWWLPELPPGASEKFMWGNADAEVLVPPLPPDQALGVDLFPHPGPAPIIIKVGNTVGLTVPGNAPRVLAVLDRRLFPDTRSSRVVFHRAETYAPGHGDTRRLSVKLFGFRLVPAGVATTSARKTQG
jgi:hypothetical protein